MIWLTDETQTLIKELEAGIDKPRMQRNWEEMMEIAPIHSGSPEEERAVQYMKKRLEEYGLECNIHRFEAYLSSPKYSNLKITAPVEMKIQSTPYRQVGTTTPEGFEASGAPLPRALFDKMLAAKNFHAGLMMLRQIEFALFDMRLHSEFDPAAGRSALELLDEVRARVAVLVPPPFNRFPNNFSHIFGGGYAAGYYSYKWAEVLSADAYSLFEENGVLDPATGARFRDEILAVGGSRAAAESFRAFRGREPKVDALLRHNGMISA